MNSTVTQTASSEPALVKWGRKLVQRREAMALPLMFIAAVLLFASMAPNFVSVDNATNVARQSVYLLIVSLGQLVVLIAGGLDLSVGATAALTSVVGSQAIVNMLGAFPDSPLLAIAVGVLVAVVIGTVVGLINGIGSAVMGIPAFMMTLGMSSVVVGLTLLMSGGVPVDGLPDELGAIFGYGRLLGIPVPTLIALVFMVLIYFVLEWTRLGRHLYATGGNKRAAALSGVRTARVGVLSFVISGILAALTGLLLTAQLGTGESNVGMSLPLQSIAACVIAGVSLAGGTGRTLWVIIGTLLISLVQNGLDLMQVGAYAASMAIGLILIFAMVISTKRSS